MAKEDLWWPERATVQEFYTAGDYAGEVSRLATARGNPNFRHELVAGSLVISNFLSGEGEPLAQNAAGYDHRRQVESVRRVFEALNALRAWEESR